MNGRVGEILIGILAEEVRFIAFAIRRDDQLGGFRGTLVLTGAMVDEAEVLLHAEAVGDVFVKELAGIELRFEFGNAKALRHDLDHAEGVAHGGFAEGEARVRAGVDDDHLGAFVRQDGGQHAAFEAGAQNGYIVLFVHLK